MAIKWETLHCFIWPGYSPIQLVLSIFSRGSPEMNSSYWHVIVPRLAVSSLSCFGLNRM
ncbi:hypothetical protein [Paenibacillus sp. TAF43_2]|uniref:hypothetical protein n=1 Tax=Paenibacillus sp. TAF43_2 TaxID=3233069 RepID=UPI003F9A8D0C